MNHKKALIPIMLVLMATAAFATVTVTVNEPTDGQAYFPNLVFQDKCITADFNVVDDNAAAYLHLFSVQYDYNAVTDLNSTLVPNDSNLDATYCTWVNDYDWTAAGGGRCTIDYCWTTHDPVTGEYVMDFNVLATDDGRITEARGRTMVDITIDNRFITLAVESMLAVLAVVLMAAALVVVVLVLRGTLSPQTALLVSVGAAVVVIAIIVMQTLIDIMIA